MSLHATPQANRLHIALFGATNAGKSSIINALTGQDVAVVSPQKGTTTDPVYKAMEVHPLGPCVFIDTAGFGDYSALGSQRMKSTEKILDKADVALLLLDAQELSSHPAWLKENSSAPAAASHGSATAASTKEEMCPSLLPDATASSKGSSDDERGCLPTFLADEKIWLKNLQDREIPVILVLNKADLLEKPSSLLQKIQEETAFVPLLTSAVTGQGIQEIRQALTDLLPHLQEEPSICGHLIQPEDTVLLVMPQDIQAPKGRLILPQVQTIRDLLDHHCLVLCVTEKQFQKALDSLKKPPALIITDSQLFREIHAQAPKESILTSFSVLFSRYKGDIQTFTQGARALDFLSAQSHILIAEACTHNALDGDIGRIKLPALLRKKLGQAIRITIVSGNDFPRDLSPYDLIIHCGSCMFNRRHVLSRIAAAKSQGVHITNYGLAIAQLTGILEEIAK